MKFSEILIQERKKKGLSKADLARELNIPYTTYLNYENGREPKLDTIKAIADALQIDVSVFFDIPANPSIEDYYYDKVYHSELEDILLYDSQVINIMKNNFDDKHDKVSQKYINLHSAWSYFHNLLKEYRNEYFVSFDQEKAKNINTLAISLIERGYEQAEYNYQKTLYISQFMNEETINKFKANNPNYKSQIINNILFKDSTIGITDQSDTFIDELYKLALSKYNSEKQEKKK